MSRVLMPRTLMGGQGADIALQTIVSKGTPAFYLGDPNPARGYVFQDAAGTVPATAASQTLGLWVDESPSGNDAFQSTEADEPTLNLTNGLYGVLGDGASKHFRTGLVPASSMTMMVAGRITSGLDQSFAGAEVGTSRFRFRANFSSTPLQVYLGTTTLLNITAAPINGIAGIAAVRVSGSNWYGSWTPISGTVETASGTFAGSIPTTQPIYVGGINDDGSADKYLGGTTWRALAQQSAYTDAEIEAIANQWSRELAALA